MRPNFIRIEAETENEKKKVKECEQKICNGRRTYGELVNASQGAPFPCSHIWARGEGDGFEWVVRCKENMEQ